MSSPGRIQDEKLVLLSSLLYLLAAGRGDQPNVGGKEREEQEEGQGREDRHTGGELVELEES